MIGHDANNIVIGYYATIDFNAPSIFLVKIINYFSGRQHDLKKI